MSSSPNPKGGALARLVAPMSAETFVAKYWHARPVYIEGHARKFAGLFDERRFFAAAERALEVRARFGGDAARERVIAGRHARKMVAEGATVCVTGLERADAGLASFLNELTADLHDVGTIDFRGYLSPDGQGYDTHYDCRIALTIQIAGEKAWWFSERPDVRFPRRGSRAAGLTGAAPSRPPAAAAMRKVVLRPGDVLSLPAGVWHRASARGRSLALNLATDHRLGALELLFTAFAGALADDPSWREPPPPVLAREGGRLPPAVRRYYAGKLAALARVVETMAPDDPHLASTWRRRVRLSSQTSRLGSGANADDGPLRPDSRLAVAPGPFVFGGGRSIAGERVVVVHADDPSNDVVLPSAALPLLRQIARRKRFVAKSAARWPECRDRFAWSDVRACLEPLVARGLLVLTG